MMTAPLRPYTPPPDYTEGCVLPVYTPRAAPTLRPVPHNPAADVMRLSTTSVVASVLFWLIWMAGFVYMCWPSAEDKHHGYD